MISPSEVRGFILLSPQAAPPASRSRRLPLFQYVVEPAQMLAPATGFSPTIETPRLSRNPAMHVNRIPHAFALGISCAAWALLAAVHAETTVIDDSELPSVGESADLIMTQAKEARLKRRLRAQLYGHLPISEDPESNAYIRSLAKRIQDGAGIEQEFDLLIVQDRRINAFAMPGGLLAFNTGLVTQARAESELAGVVAHEMAHVTQRHLARMYDQMQNSNFNILATAGILLAGLYDLSALMPAAFIGQAADIQRYLNHSRDNEREADRFATRYLAQAGIDPHGVANFFEVLMGNSARQYNRELEYLSTHPASVSRIVEAHDRARQHPGEYVRDHEEFHFIRERMIALLAPVHERLEQYRRQMDARHQPSAAEQYGIAITWQRHGNHQKALEALQAAQAQGPEARLLVQLAHIPSWRHLGESDLIFETLASLYAEYPDHYAVEFYMAQAYVNARQSREALKIARKRIRRGIQDPQTFRLIAEAASASNQPAISHIALSDYYASRAQFRQAHQQLDIAEQHTKANTANQARINQRRTELMRMAKGEY